MPPSVEDQRYSRVAAAQGGPAPTMHGLTQKSLSIKIFSAMKSIIHVFRKASDLKKLAITSMGFQKIPLRSEKFHC
jgi:hypothetical protein